MRTILDFVDRQDLIDQVLNQVARDVEDKDFTAIEMLLEHIPDSLLINYLPEEY